MKFFCHRIFATALLLLAGQSCGHIQDIENEHESQTSAVRPKKRKKQKTRQNLTASCAAKFIADLKPMRADIFFEDTSNSSLLNQYKDSGIQNMKSDHHWVLKQDPTGQNYRSPDQLPSSYPCLQQYTLWILEPGKHCTSIFFLP